MAGFGPCSSDSKAWVLYSSISPRPDCSSSLHAWKCVDVEELVLRQRRDSERWEGPWGDMYTMVLVDCLRRNSPSLAIDVVSRWKSFVETEMVEMEPCGLSQHWPGSSVGVGISRVSLWLCTWMCQVRIRQDTRSRLRGENSTLLG